MTLLLVILMIVLIGTVVELRNRVSRLERDYAALTKRGREAMQPAEAAAALPDEVATASVEAEAVSTEKTDAEPAALEPVAKETAAAAAAVAQSETITDAAPAKAPEKADVTRNIETALGTRWAVWVGGLALAFGGLFLVRYSIEAGWFGPMARLSLAAIFGVVLMAGGEFIRRTGFKVPVQGISNVYIPAILTAAGAFTLFGAIYAAHGVYGFIGPATAFVLLGAAAVATIGLALLHGQPLAGLGLLGALATPMLVASDAPNPWALFVYLAIVLVAAVVVAGIRFWPFLAAAAFAGVGLWTLAYLAAGDENSLVVLFIQTVGIAALCFIWLRDSQRPARVDISAVVVAGFGTLTAMLLAAVHYRAGIYYGAAAVALMVLAPVLRGKALPLLFGAGLAAISFVLPRALGTSFVEDTLVATLRADAVWSAGWSLSALFLAVGLWMARRSLLPAPLHAAIWSAAAASVPVITVACLWIGFGNFNQDYGYAAAALALAVVLAAAAEWLGRAEEPPLTGGLAVSFALFGSGAAAVAAIHAGFGPAATTILVGALAAVAAVLTRWRSYPALGWVAVAAFFVTLARVIYEPTIVGDYLQLATAMPVFNVLLPGYGVPALAFAFAAWQLARTTNGRPRLVMEVAAVLFTLLTVGMLVRHAMTGGDMSADYVTLAEQAIYTLMALGGGGALIAIGQRADSIVMRYGSLTLGCLSAAMIAVAHFVTLNPLVTDESTGQIPVFNLLFLAYLLPAIAAGAVALYARGKRPKWFSAMLGLLASLLAFSYLTLSVRRFYQGEFIAWWRDTTQLEMYSYSALWLVFGVVLLVIGVKLQSYILRIASAALISIAVLKVFILDMAALEGVLRALSFIGLGAVLIGIGLFYQRLLVGSSKAPATPPAPAPDEPPALP